jgi:hypothetical protein
MWRREVVAFCWTAMGEETVCGKEGRRKRATG